jgi:hypothetical protein
MYIYHDLHDVLNVGRYDVAHSWNGVVGFYWYVVCEQGQQPGGGSPNCSPHEKKRSSSPDPSLALTRPFWVS